MYSECINGIVVEYFPARIPRGYIHCSRISGGRHGKAIDRFSRVRIQRRKEISAMPPSEAALYPSSGSVHVRRNSDPAGIALGISKTDCVGGRASDLWCNANLSEFYSPPPFAADLFLSPFLVFSPAGPHSFTTRRRRWREVGIEERTKYRDGGGSRFLKKIAISRKL